MEYTTNAKMMLGYIDDDDDEILDYDGNLELSTDNEDEDEAESMPDYNQQQQYPETPEERINWQEQIRMIHLRSHLNQLFEKVKHAQYITDKTREELKKCRGQIQQYEAERDQLFKEIQNKESDGNHSSVYRVRAAHERVCHELEAEQKLETMIIERLDQAEYELALVEVERGKFILAEDDLLQREQQLSKEKTDMAMIRLHKEEILAKQALITRHKDQRTQKEVQLDTERRHQQAIEEAERSHERANKYLNKTIEKMNKRQEEEEVRYKTDMTKKMDMLLKLKNDITHNRDNLRAIRARDKAAERKEEMAEQEERRIITAKGGNPEEILLVKKRKNEVKKQKQQFESEQKVKKAEIMQKILAEEDNLKRRKQRQPYLWDTPEREKSLRVGPHVQKPLKSLDNYIKASADEGEAAVETIDNKEREILKGVEYISLTNIAPPVELAPVDTKKKPEGKGQRDKNKNAESQLFKNMSDNSSAMGIEDLMEEEFSRLGLEGENEEKLDQAEERAMEMELAEDEGASREITLHLPEKEDSESSDNEDDERRVDLAKPEFEGLWDTKTKPYRVPKDSDLLSSKPAGGSKMDKEILKKTLDKTREGIVITQVAAGREFSGCPFYSKPDVIHFKDFVVGKTYKKKVALTNVSYTVNYIKFIDITERLKDFIKIHFDPPGQMSAGLTCEMTVTFKPMINEDLNGEVNFLTQTGPFHIPLVCSTKKCDLTLDTTSVDFGTMVIGETLKRSFTLTNRGALGTKFDFFKVTGMKQRTLTTAGTSLGRMEESDDGNKEGEKLLDNLKDNMKRNSERNEVTGLAETNAVVKEDNVFSKTNDSMRAVSPDSAEVPEKPRQTAGSNLAVDSKKKSEEELEKIPEAGEGAGPTEAVSGVEGSEVTEGNAGEVVPEGSDQKQEHESDEATSPDLAVSEMDDYGSLDGMRVGPFVTGEIGPFSSLCLEIIWQPTIPGKVDSEFMVSFADPLSEPLSIHALANAIDVPVWVERQSVDLKICMFDRLYQDTIIVNNRATTALRLKFEVCKELRNHLELLPKTGYIQAQSQFSAQLKFLPRQSLFEEAAKFFDPETGVLEAPMTIRVADQTTPVAFTVQAVVTNSDLEFDTPDIDFGYCTIHESVKKTIKLTNKSILPQEFGFVGLPEYVEVQPNDGFGTLLPLETIELDVIFSPSKTREYKLDLVCRSLINRDFKISCKGVGVLTPLELSHQVIHLAATPLYDISTAALHVINTHTSSNEFTHPVPRIGKGEICPVGPTSFEFMVPKNTPITISPSVGTVQPGKKCRIQVRFTPTLNDYEVRQEALRIHTKMEAAREEKEREEAALREKMEKENAQRKKEANSVLPKKRGKPERKGNPNENQSNKQRNNSGNNQKYSTSDDACETDDEKWANISENKYVTEEDSFPSGFHETHKIAVPGKLARSKTHHKKEKPGDRRQRLMRTNTEVQQYGRIHHSGQQSVQVSWLSSAPFRKGHKCYDTLKENREDSHRICVLTSVTQSSTRGKKIIEGKDLNQSPVQSDVQDQNQSSADLMENMNNSMADTEDSNPSGFQRETLTSEAVNDNDSMEGEESAQRKLSEKDNEAAVTDDFEDEDAGGGKGAKNKGKEASPKGGALQSKASKLSAAPSSTGSAITQESTPRFDPDKISRDSSEYLAAVTSLMRQYKGQFQTVTVPCYVASGATGNPGELSYSIHNTLYLTIHCPAIKPPVVVISDGGKRIVDFGDVSIGQTTPKSITLQNISDKNLELKSTVTNPSGPFLVLNALRALAPGATHTILLTFSPLQGQMFQEELGIKTMNSTLHLTLKGHGVSPMVNLSVENGLMDMSAVLVGEYVEKPFTIQNTAPLAIDYVIKQDSLSQLRHAKAQAIPPFLNAQQEEKNYVGTQNDNGRNVFDIVPTKGSIQAGETKEILVTFAPDHESDHYSDGIRIELFDQEESHFFQLLGAAKPRVMFLSGDDPLVPSVESLALEPVVAEEEEVAGEAKGALPMSPPALVTIKSVMKDDMFQPGVREIYAGCVRTMAVSQKKNGEFSVEGIQGLLQKGFTVEPQKGMVEAGTKKPIVFTWTPPAGYDPSNAIEETATLTLRCDVTEQITLMIRAMVVTE